MNLEERLSQIETELSIGLPMSMSDLCRWFVMFCEQRGTGHATGGYLPNDEMHTEEEWLWFENNKANAEKSFQILENKKHGRTK